MERETLGRWDKVRTLFTSICENEELTRDQIEVIEKEVDFGSIDGINIWDYLSEAVSWGEMEISEDGEIFKMTDEGKKRWQRFINS